MKNKITPKSLIIICISLIISCEKSGVTEESYPISDVSFNYLQASNKFFISAYASNRYQGNNLDSLMVLWQGVSASDVADTIRLFDNGTKGDLISKDQLYSHKITNPVSYTPLTLTTTPYV